MHAPFLLLALASGAAPSLASAAELYIPAPKPGHTRPLVVVVAGNGGAETTDFIVPFGVLKDSALFEVRAVSMTPGPVQLRRTIKILADQTTQAFDASTPEGADIVIVPAQMSPKDAALNEWIRAQARRGATIVSICEGARVLANAGLLDGKKAVSHWSSFKSLEKSNPSTRWVRDRRYLQDGTIISTAGVSASLPVSVALVEAVGGPAAAQLTASHFGISDWSVRHRTADYGLSKPVFNHALRNVLAVWRHETVELPVAEGDDEVALALRADAWTRSYRTKVSITHNPARQPVKTLHGLRILADSLPKKRSNIALPPAGPAVQQLDGTLAELGRRYGSTEVTLAKIGMEYGEPSDDGTH